MSIWIRKSPSEIMDASEHTQLKKNLRAIDLAALGIGSVVGTGIFVATGQGAKLAGPGVLVSFIVAAIITPPDVVSQLALAIPMCLLYEVGIWAAQIFIKHTQAPAEEGSGTPT